jgi:small ligand-binding sensory domain FIST
VRQYASALSQHPVPAHAVGETAGHVIDAFAGEPADLAVFFASPHFVGAFEDIVHALQELLAPRVLLGATAASVIGGARELEDTPAFSLFAARLDGASLTPLELHVEETPDGATVVGWPDLDNGPDTLLMLTDPFTFPVDGFLRRLNEDRPGLAVIGGLASAGSRPGTNRLVLDGSVLTDGAVGVFLGGVPVETVVSQGCRPIGDPFVVTRGERNFVEELAGRSALERLRELAASATEDERALLQRGLHMGLVVDEHKADFVRGDFLVRNVLGADERSGAVAIGDQVHIGQTVQFHVRDAGAADEDLRALLAGHGAKGALVFTCNGRGRHLFGVPDHDAGVVAEILGPLPAAGMFCAGEIGPVGGRNFLHGFTASLALFD